MTQNRSQTLSDQIHEGTRELGLELPPESERRLDSYLRLLAKWNRTYNLTAVRDQGAMVSQHLLDSLAVLPVLRANWKRGDALADVGSGGGLPGIPLAIACPHWQVELIESSHKKAAFLEQAKIELKLDNVSVHCVRVEAFKPKELFAMVISRAFASLADLIRLAAHLLAPGGRLLAMKGRHPREEIEQLPPGWQLRQSVPLTVPKLAAHRDLIVIERA